MGTAGEIHRTTHPDGRRDVTVFAPTADGRLGVRPALDGGPLLTPEETIQAQWAAIRDLERELRKQEIAAGTLADAAVQLATLANEALGRALDAPLRVPQERVARLVGSSITIAQDGDDVVYRWRQRIENPGLEGV